MAVILFSSCLSSVTWTIILSVERGELAGKFYRTADVELTGFSTPVIGSQNIADGKRHQIRDPAGTFSSSAETGKRTVETVFRKEFVALRAVAVARRIRRLVKFSITVFEHHDRQANAHQALRFADLHLIDDGGDNFIRRDDLQKLRARFAPDNFGFKLDNRLPRFAVIVV